MTRLLFIRKKLKLFLVCGVLALVYISISFRILTFLKSESLLVKFERNKMEHVLWTAQHKDIHLPQTFQTGLNDIKGNKSKYSSNSSYTKNVTNLLHILPADNDILNHDTTTQFPRSVVKTARPQNEANNTDVNVARGSSRVDAPEQVHHNDSTPRAAPNETLFLTGTYFGRLGNNMFIYAAVVGLARALKRVPIFKDGYLMSNILQISHVNRNIDTSKWLVEKQIKYATFEQNLTTLPKTNVSIYGALQSWKYFENVQDEIRREFTLNLTLQKERDAVLAAYRSRLQNHVLVGVHVRRGDLLEEVYVRWGYGVANKSFFANAFHKMRSLLPGQNITFLVSSDDMPWCKNNLDDPSVQLLSNGSTEYHFAILSGCDHVILTGGTFGWWIAWLVNGITIYYEDFVRKGSNLYKGFSEEDYYPSGWIGLKN
ncbi:galactoside alpha-(1,2)-fucosyltransferase 2-like [Biomphalaria glabrata]|uniref:L-Fucosyltransferase n=1 Tax=Biomphalaria glabrata TaxID=6526 RepID=A0A9W3BHK0_BIOGL|nr:galactoside alpha-(1,2)-fucosyltransferase 2-like [Biomphalaria glabrata]